MTTEPTDAELDEVLCGQWPAFSMQATLVRMWVRQAMRDAIARWGQPSVAGEAVWIQPNHLQHARKAPFLCRVEPKQRDDFVPLHTTPQPTQAQAGAEPLTDEQIAAIWAQKPRYHAAPIGKTDIEFARAIEAAHGIGIKDGDSHGLPT